MKITTVAVFAAAALVATVFGAPSASANAAKDDGPVTIKVLGEGLTVSETMTTLLMDHDFPGNLQAYYVIVPPPGDTAHCPQTHYSEHVLDGPFRPGVARDSYGPTGAFLEGTMICAGWLDPTGHAHLSGYPCVTIKR